MRVAVSVRVGGRWGRACGRAGDWDGQACAREGSARACGRWGRACGRLGGAQDARGGAGCGWVRTRRAGAKRLSGVVGRRPRRAGANHISMSSSMQKEPTRRSAQTVMGRGALAKRADGDGNEEGAGKDGGAGGEHGAAGEVTRSRRVVGGGAQGAERHVTDRAQVEVAAGRGTPRPADPCEHDSEGHGQKAAVSPVFRLEGALCLRAAANVRAKLLVEGGGGFSILKRE